MAINVKKQFQENENKKLIADREMVNDRANTRENRSAPYNPLSSFSSPTLSNPVTTTKPKNITPKAKTNSQISKDIQGYLDTLAKINENVNAIIIPEVAGSGNDNSGKGGFVVSNMDYSGSVITPTPSTPSLPITITPPPPPVKTATLDIILFDDKATSIDTMADLIFENIGGQELINITRSDIVNGQKISYQPIKNLSSIQQRYNPNNILSLQQTSDKYFSGFSIKLEDKIPNEGNGINGENIYIEESTGDLIIEFININNDEQIELQITTDGTIYEADLGEIAS